jgi:hypothetical protein
MDKFRLSLALEILVFFLPVNIYVVGDWLGTGVQWVLFRYQQTYIGNSLIPFTNEIAYVLGGVIAGRSAISLCLWSAAAVFFIVSLVFIVLANINRNPREIKSASLLTSAGGILCAVSVFTQYGLVLKSEAGFSVPVGIPLILVIGYWMLQERYESGQ